MKQRILSLALVCLFALQAEQLYTQQKVFVQLKKEHIQNLTIEGNSTLSESPARDSEEEKDTYYELAASYHGHGDATFFSEVLVSSV